MQISRIRFLLPAATFLVVQLTGCRDASVILEEEQIEQDLALDLAGKAPTKEEKALLLNANRWVEKTGGIAGVGGKTVHPVFAADNALVLWAMSNPRYSWSRKNGYAKKLRDFIVAQADESTGKFRFGITWDEKSGATAPKPGQPAMPTQALWGVVRYTSKIKQEGGKLGNGAAYHRWAKDMLRKQHELVLNGSDADRYTSPGPMAFHMVACATLGKAFGEDEFVTKAKDTWARLSTKEDDGAFQKDALRDSQVLFALHEVGRLFPGQFPGMAEAEGRLRGKFKDAGKSYPAVDYAPEDKVDSSTQTFGYLIAAGRRDGWVKKGFLRHAIRKHGGIMFVGNAQERDEGPTEAQGMGWVGTSSLSK